MKRTIVNAAASAVHFVTHDLWCRTCNPLVVRRRARHVADVRAGGDMAYFRNLVEQDRVANYGSLVEQAMNAPRLPGHDL